MVEFHLLDFVEIFKRIAKQALWEHAGESVSGETMTFRIPFARWKEDLS